MNSVAVLKSTHLLDLGLTEKEARQYSVGAAILSTLQRDASCLERDVSDAIQASVGRPVRAGGGIFIPTRLNLRASGLDTKTNAAGDFTVQPRVMDLTEALQSQMVLSRLGATFLGGLKFSAAFPIEDSASKASWVAENPASDVAESDQRFRCVTASPHTLTSTTSASRQLLQQASGSFDLENRIRLNLMRGTAQAFDQAGITGSGELGEPIGLLRVAGTNTTALGQNGAVPTYSSICDMEGAVANANSPDSIAWLTTPDVRKLLRKTYVNGVGSDPVWASNSVLGNQALVTTAVPSNLSKGTSNGTLSALICGHWQEMLLAEFGVVEVLVDQFRLKKQGLIELTSFSLVDVAIPRPAVFDVCTDVSLS